MSGIAHKIGLVKILLDHSYKNSSLLAGNYMFKVHNKNTGARCEICSTLTTKTLEWCIGVILVSLFLNLNIFHTLFQCYYC